jgi:hypothetical protein
VIASGEKKVVNEAAKIGSSENKQKSSEFFSLAVG